VVDGRLPGVPFGHRLAEFAAAFTAGRAWVYGIFPDPSLPVTDGDEATVLGSAGLYPRVGPGAIEIGAWLVASATGRGLATSVAIALVEVAFTSDAIERIEMRCHPANAPSNRVPSKLGFHVLRTPAVPARGLTVWAIGRDAWRALAAQPPPAR
jgi:RimJ/RimL family protein N-acetyltransferase